MQSIDISPLEHGLKQCFVDKNKYIKKDITVEFVTLCSSVDKDISPEDKENFHEFLRSATNTFTQNVYSTKDSTYNLLRPLQRNKDYELIATDLSKQQNLDADPKAIHQINFTGKLENNATQFFIIGEAKETVLDFSKGTVKVL